jgi:hypothetical protein
MRAFSWICGAGERSRTPDLRITNALLYLLSYTGMERRIIGFRRCGLKPAPVKTCRIRYAVSRGVIDRQMWSRSKSPCRRAIGWPRRCWRPA